MVCVPPRQDWKATESRNSSPRSRFCHGGGSAIGPLQRKPVAVFDWNLARTAAATTIAASHARGIRGSGQVSGKRIDRQKARSRCVCEHDERTNRPAGNDWNQGVTKDFYCVSGGFGHGARCSPKEILVAGAQAIEKQRAVINRYITHTGVIATTNAT